VKAVFCLALLAANCVAQPRAIEVLGQVGRSRFGGDEGSLGSATTFGAGAVLPLTAKWAVDVDVQTGSSEEDFPPPERFTIRRTLLSPAIVRRWGTERLYGFAGGGIGLQVDSTESVWRTYSGNPPVESGLGRGEYTDSAPTLVGKLGIAAAPAGPLLIRGDLLLVWRYVLPTVGVRIGVGYGF
jgi:hypothetical protein